MPGPASLPHRLRRRAGGRRLHLRRGRGACSARSPTRPWVATRRRRGCGVPTTASPLSTLTRLFLLQARVDERAADRALAGLLDELAAEGFVQRSGGEVVARLDVRPYAADGVDLWVVSDLTPASTARPPRWAPTTCSASAPPRRRWPGSPSASRWGTRSTSAPGAACSRCTSRRTPTVSSRPTSTSGRCGSRRFNLALNDVPAGRVDVRAGLVLRARRRRGVRPHHHQPAVRHLARDRGTAGLPRLGTAGRPGRRARRHHRAGAPATRGLVPGAGQLGRRPGPAVGRATGRLGP